LKQYKIYIKTHFCRQTRRHCLSGKVRFDIALTVGIHRVWTNRICLFLKLIYQMDVDCTAS